MSDDEQCRPLLGDDGEVLAVVRGAEPLDERGEEAMRALVAAVHRMWADMDPAERADLEGRQDASRERIRARLERLRGGGDG